MTVFPTVALTGHRPRSFTVAQAEWVRRTALPHVAARLRDTYGTTTAISGLAVGSDTWWADAALDAGLALYAYLPFLAQPRTWPAPDREHWQHLRDRAVHEVIVGDTPQTRYFHVRNARMVNDADLLVAVHVDGTDRGGTAATIRVAQRVGRPVLVVEPASRAYRKIGWPAST